MQLRAIFFKNILHDLEDLVLDKPIIMILQILIIKRFERNTGTEKAVFSL